MTFTDGETMPSIKNDELLESAFQDELKKIPPFLRLTKKSLIIAGILVGIGLIIMAVLLIIKINPEPGGMLGGFENMITFTQIVTLSLICISPVGLWFALCYYLEKKAFRKASEFLQLVSHLEEEKIKANVGDYQYKKHEPETKPEDDFPEPKVCRVCGNLQFDKGSKCSECGADLD